MTLKSLPIILTLAVALAGCGSSSSGGGSSANNATTVKVVFIPKNTGNAYFKPVIAGFQDEAKATNIDFSSDGPAKGDETSQLPIIKDQVQEGVDVLSLSANSPDALNEALDSARAKGITVVTVDSDLTGNESHRDLGVLSTDFSKVGPSQLELLGKMLNYKGDFAILSATTAAPNQNAWIAGIQTALKDPKYAGMKLVTVVYGDDEPQKSSTEMEGLLTKYPDLKGVISPTSVGLAAAAQVLEDSGQYPGGPNAKNGGVVLTGLSTPNQMRKAVDKGVVQAFQLWDPTLMGEIAAYMGAQIHDKKIDAKPGVTVDVPNVGKVTILDKNVVYAGPLVTFDKSNIAKYDF